MLVDDTGACHLVRSAWSRDQEGCGPNQSAVYSPHVLRFAAASALLADPERSQEQSALPMGPVCHTVELIRDQNMRSKPPRRLACDVLFAIFGLSVSLCSDSANHY